MPDQTEPLSAALDQLLKADGDAIREIDQRIDALQAQIDNLRRVRKFLSPGRANATSADGKPSPKQQELIDQMVSLIRKQGPLSPTRIAVALETSPSLVGRAVKRSAELTNEDGRIILAAKEAHAR